MVSEKIAGDAAPGAVAETINVPATPLAVKDGEAATPEAFVTPEAVRPAPVNVPLGPLAGAVKVTVTPLNGFPLASCTVALKGAANCALSGALCGVPPEGVIAGGPVELCEKANCNCEKSKGTVRSTIIVNVLALGVWLLAGTGAKFSVSCPATTRTLAAALEAFAATDAAAGPEFTKVAL